MMGREAPLQCKLFYKNVNLEWRIRGNHPLCHIAQCVDIDLAYQEVEIEVREQFRRRCSKGG